MTLLGKIFTVLILIMSVLFMGFAIMVYATHTNWKKVANNASPGPGEELGLQQKLAAQEEINRQLRELRESLLNDYAMEMAARRFSLAALQSKLDEAQQRLETQEQVLQNLTATEGTTAAALDVAQKTLVAMTDEVKVLRDQIREAQADVDEKFATLVALTDEVNQARRTTKDLEDRQKPLLNQVAHLKDIIAKKGIRYDVQPDGTVLSDVNLEPPSVGGEILEVGDKDLLEISLGWEDGIRVGHELDVYRNNSYLGRVVVLKTQPDRAVAKIIPEFQKGLIKKGDRVHTKLS